MDKSETDRAVTVVTLPAHASQFSCSTEVGIAVGVVIVVACLIALVIVVVVVIILICCQG